MAFDEADRCKITAAIGTSTSKQELQRLVLTAKVDDIRQLVFDTLAYDVQNLPRKHIKPFHFRKTDAMSAWPITSWKGPD